VLLTNDVEHAIATARATCGETTQRRRRLRETRLALEWQRARAHRSIATLERSLETLQQTLIEASGPPRLHWTPAYDLLDDVLFPVD
jgi:hypothetical protein